MIILTLHLSNLLLFINGDSSVHILSEQYGNGQLITSSTLNWIPDIHYSASKNFVIGGFEIIENLSDLSQIKKRPIFVCRALHNGIWVAGGQKEGDKHCTVTLTGNVCSYERYQLLENIESAARVSWNDWNKFYRPFVGSVATDKLYIARFIANETTYTGRRSKQTHYIGTLSSQDTLGTITYVKEDGKEASTEIGQLLVETEPISYELKAVILNYVKKRIVKKMPYVLGKVTIKNEGPKLVKMAEAFGYTYLHTLYWGQGHAMLKGLNTTVILQNKTHLPDMKWGIDIKKNHTGVYTVEVYLEPGTGVNVTFYGHYVDLEIPYSGQLFSHYKDSASTDPRMISGVRREERVTDIVPNFGSIYYLSNFNIAPTTTKSTFTNYANNSTTIMTTHQLMTMMTTLINNHHQSIKLNLKNSELEEQFDKKNTASDENSILNSVNHPEESSMQRDDGRPLSLKEKGESSPSTTCSFQISNFIFLTTIMQLLILLFNQVT